MNTLLHTMLRAAKYAGDEILNVYHTDNFDIELKNDQSPLTLADKKAHLKIVEFLEKTDFPILSEEGKHLPYEERKHWTKYWLVDPLDGTKEFIKRNGEFTVNIALINHNKPVLGVIFVPVTKELYFGGEELGSFKIENTENIDIESLESILGAAQKMPFPQNKRPFTAVGSRSHSSPETEAVFETLKLKHGAINIISKGSSLKFCLLAEGKADIYPRLGPTMEWDTAAGHAIALFSGVSVVRYETNEPLTYNKAQLLNPYFLAERR